MLNTISEHPLVVSTFLAITVGIITFLTADSVAWAAIAAALGAVLGYTASNWKNIRQGGASVLAAIRDTLRLLSNPYEAIKLSIEAPEMNPDPNGGPKSYIRLGLRWQNTSYVDVEISHIRGQVGVSSPEEGNNLPLVSHVRLKRRQSTNDSQRIIVHLTDQALGSVNRLRIGQERQVNLDVRIQANVNNHPMEFFTSTRAYLD